MTKPIIIQLPLEGVTLDMFEEVFQKTGMKSRTEYLRVLISQEYERQNDTRAN